MLEVICLLATTLLITLGVIKGRELPRSGATPWAMGTSTKPMVTILVGAAMCCIPTSVSVASTTNCNIHYCYCCGCSGNC